MSWFEGTLIIYTSAGFLAVSTCYQVRLTVVISPNNYIFIPAFTYLSSRVTNFF